MKKKVVVLTSDLFFSSNLEGGAARAGFEMAMASTLTKLEDKLANTACQALVVDLAHPDAANIAELVETVRSNNAELRIIAYAQHVQVDRLKQARAAGCDHVTTRGDIVKSLADLLT